MNETERPTTPGGAVDAGAGPAPGRVVPIHPMLVAVFPILALYARNAQQLEFRVLMRPLGYALLGTVVAWLLAGLAMRSLRKGALAASALCVAFFSYGHAAALADRHNLGDYVGPALVGLVLLALYVIVRARGTLGTATNALNLASVALVAPSLWGSVFPRHVPMPVARPGARAGAPAGPVALARGLARPVAASQMAEAPDVYLIVLDAYERADGLRALYGFDNGPFLQALEERGFVVPAASRSNYNETPLCMASTLSMDYLNDLAPQVQAGVGLEALSRPRMQQAKVAGILKDLGYEFVYVWTEAGQTQIDTADVLLKGSSDLSGFEGEVVGMTALDAAPGQREKLYDVHRGRILTAFSHLAEVSRRPERKFVLAHIMAPHPPFVFGPNGELANPRRPFSYDDGSRIGWYMSHDQYRKGYTDQLQFVNKRLLVAIDAIIGNSKRPPIIVLQGDHGSRLGLDWGSVDKTDMRETWSIMSAYRVPRAVQSRIYPTITPVNSFRLILSHAFGQDLPLLPDRSYYSSEDAPQPLTDVTDRIPKTVTGPPLP